MGYHIETMDKSFYIKNENKAGALQAVKELNKKEQDLGNGGIHYKGKHTRLFKWVNSTIVNKAKTLEDALSEWRWESTVDSAGNIVDIVFTGEKIGDDTYLFKAIAAFVKEDSFIEFRGEDGHMWSLEFDNGFYLFDGRRKDLLNSKKG